MKDKIICVIGLGYIGLPTAALLANKGYSVIGVDLNHKIVETINKGLIHIVEPDLDLFVKKALEKNKLKAFTRARKSDVYIICVPTPLHEKHKFPKPNINYIIEAVKNIAPIIKAGDYIILESTSPVGTTNKIKNILNKLKVDTKQLNIAYCPERVLPGKVMTELVQNDRIVGGIDNSSTKNISNFYREFVTGNVYETDAKTAEMCKLVENSSRDVNIALANELSIICDEENINVWNLIELANKHPRVNILQPGPGVGGHCIAVDPWFIITKNFKNSQLIKKAREINLDKTNWVIKKIKSLHNNFYDKNKFNPRIVCLGLAFKANIDDLRESPALKIANFLKASGYNIVAVEPNIDAYKSIKLIDISEICIEKDLVVILVKHSEFISKKVINRLKKSNTVDFCGLLN